MSSDGTLDDHPPVSGRATQSKDEIGPDSLIWAKLSRYPWWPALVLERTDKRIPAEERRKTQTSTPVLFFGTAEFSWIDASRNISPWETEKLNRSTKDKSVEFKRALQEAGTYATKGTLPTSFEVDAYEQQPEPVEAPPLYANRNTKKRVSSSLKHAPYPLLYGEELHFDERDRRRLTVQRSLGLAPPWNSPAAADPVVNPNIAALVQRSMFQQQAPTALPPALLGGLMM